MFKFFSSSKVYPLIQKLINFINSIFFLILIIGLTFALVLSPPDYLQGDSVRIMYVHVPSAWIGLACFSTITLLSVLNFIFKIKNFYFINKSIWQLVYSVLSSISYRFNLGKTNMGNLVGMGRKTYLNVSFDVILCVLYFNIQTSKRGKIDYKSIFRHSCCRIY